MYIKLALLFLLIIYPLMMLQKVAVASSCNPGSQDVCSQNLDDDFLINKVASQALLPPVLYETPTPGVSPIPNQTLIGVSRGFFSFLPNFRNFVCSLFSQTSFCKENLNVASGDINNLSNLSSLINRTQLPEQVIPTPPVSDSNLSDVNSNTAGNTKISTISGNLGTKTGLYGVDLPDFSQDIVPTVTQEENSNENLSSYGTPFKGDQRIPSVDAWQHLFYSSNYPPGIEPFGLPTPTPTP